MKTPEAIEAINTRIAELCGLAICPGCKNEVDPEVCHCGDTQPNHPFQAGHNFIPIGCTCGYADQSTAAKGQASNYFGELHRQKLEQIVADKGLWTDYSLTLRTILDRDAQTPTGPTGPTGFRLSLGAASAPQICEAFLTCLWHQRYLGTWSPKVEKVAKKHQPDLYLLTGDEIPFVQDGTRDGEHIRHAMHQSFLDKLREQDVPFLLLQGSHTERMSQATEAIELLVKSPLTI